MSTINDAIANLKLRLEADKGFRADLLKRITDLNSIIGNVQKGIKNIGDCKNQIEVIKTKLESANAETKAAKDKATSIEKAVGDLNTLVGQLNQVEADGNILKYMEEAKNTVADIHSTVTQIAKGSDASQIAQRQQERGDQRQQERGPFGGGRRRRKRGGYSYRRKSPSTRKTKKGRKKSRTRSRSKLRTRSRK